MDSVLLKILDLFQWLFRLTKVDYEQLRAIVSIKLIMDNRRQIINYNRRQKTEPGNAFIMTMFFYVLFGLFIGLALFAIPSFMLSMIVFFSYIMVMIAMTLVTDFSSVLLDTSDNTIVLPRPVDSRTLFFARITHIFLYLGQLTFGLSLIPSAVVIIKYGPAFLPLFIIGTTLAVITALVFTNIIYLLIMQFVSEEKLKNVINYFQIVMAVLIMGGYQLMPRMMDQLDLKNEVFELSRWSFFAPPVWIAGALETFRFSIYDLDHIILTAFAVVVPLAAFYSVSNYLTPAFTKKLGSMASSVEPVGDAKNDVTGTSNGTIARVSSWVTKGTVEQGAFEMIYKILGRDRKIKLKVYPSFGYIIVFGFIFIIRSKEDLATTLASLPETEYYLVLLYLTFFVLQVALHELPYSDDFKASWVYFSTPVDKPGEILLGTLKALFVGLLLPAYFVISVFVFIVWGYDVFDDIVFAFFNNFLMLIVLASINKKHLPLSMAPSVRGQAGNFLRGILTVLLIGILGFAHYLLAQKPLLLIGTIPLQLLVIFLIVKAYKNLPWKSITF